MELIAFETNKITSLFLASPYDGKLHLPLVIRMLVERYSFSTFPKTIEEISGDHVAFRGGVFNGVTISELGVYSDGIIVSANTDTDTLDAFEVDLCKWLEADLKIRRVESHEISKTYESRIVIRSETSPLAALDVLNDASQMLHRSLKNRTKMDTKFVPFSLGLAADHALIGGMKPVAFRVERKVSAPFDSHLYISVAPVPTKDHLKILDALLPLG